MLCEPITGDPNTNYRPSLALRLLETAGGRPLWKLTDIKQVAGPRTPITDALETGSEKVGHGLLLRWMPGGEAIIHRMADLHMEQKPNVTWLEVRMFHHDLITAIIMDVPLANAAAKEYALVNTTSWNRRANQIWEMHQRLRGS